tara:strand:+ start:134 stop:505 length:372 start_codon:yes stop_codon:yes gene_type:complete
MKMKIGVEVQIDVKKIEKARLYAGAKGTYLTMTTFIDLDEKDQYENNGFISHKKNKDEQNNTPILGNVKVFWKDGQQAQQPAPQQGGYQQQAPQQQAPQQAPQQSPMAQNPNASQNFDSDIPF